MTKKIALISTLLMSMNFSISADNVIKETDSSLGSTLNDQREIGKLYNKYEEELSIGQLTKSNSVNTDLTEKKCREILELPFLNYQDDEIISEFLRQEPIDLKVRRNLARQIINQVADGVIDDQSLLPLLEHILLQYNDYLQKLQIDLEEELKLYPDNHTMVICGGETIRNGGKYTPQRIRFSLYYLDEIRAYYEMALIYSRKEVQEGLNERLNKMGYDQSDLPRISKKLNQANAMATIKEFPMDINCSSMNPLYSKDKFEKLLKLHAYDLFYQRVNKCLNSYFQAIQNKKSIDERQSIFLACLYAQYYTAQIPFYDNKSECKTDIRTKHDIADGIGPRTIAEFDLSEFNASSKEINELILSNKITIIKDFKKKATQLSSVKELNFEEQLAAGCDGKGTLEILSRKHDISNYIESLDRNFLDTINYLYSNNKNIQKEYFQQVELTPERIKKLKNK